MTFLRWLFSDICVPADMLEAQLLAAAELRRVGV